MPLSLDLHILSIAVFLLAVSYVLWRDRENIERYAIVFVRRTKRGIEYLDRIASISPTAWRYWSTLGVAVGFVSMVAIFVVILQQTVRLFFVGDAIPPVGPVLPTVNTVTNPMQAGYLGLPFWHLLISLSIILFVHELAHGVIARVEEFDIEYVGLILFGIIPGAFVQPKGQRDFFEPEEGERSSPWENGTPLSRLRVLAAGPMANLSLAAVLFLLIFATFNVSHGAPKGFYTENGIDVVNVSSGYPAAEAGIHPGMTIVEINGSSTLNLQQFSTATQGWRPNQSVDIVTAGNGTFHMTLAERQVEGNITYEPAPMDQVFPVLEQQVPGTIAFYETYLAPLLQESTETHIGRWTWLSERFPGLEQRAEQRIAELRDTTDDEPDGIIGATVTPNRQIGEGLEPLVGPLYTLYQSLFIVAMLNFMIGLANLLPVKGLDGGWMLHVAATEYLGDRGEELTRKVTMITVLVIAISFAFLISRFLL